jgi:hypothetical protein
MSEFSGFIGQAYEAASITQDSQALINWYPETDSTKFVGSPSTGVPEERGVTALYPTPGLVTRFQLQYGQVRGFHVFAGSNTLYVVCGNLLYSVTRSYVATSVGTLLTSTGRVYISDNGVGLYVVDGANRYSYVPGTGVFTVLADGAFNGGTTCDIVDNFIFYNDPSTNQFGCTNVGDVVSGALNFGSKIGSPDNIVACIADHRQVLLLGEVESERWINAGTFPFPFAVIPGTSIQHGLQAQNTIARLGEGIAFLAKDDRGFATVVIWGATFAQPLRISTFAIENAIQGYAVTDDAIAYSYAQSGHEFYMLTFPSADVTWCYDLATQMWHRRAWRDQNNVLHRHRSNCAVAFNGANLVGDWENGKVYEFSTSVYTDDGNPIPCIRRCAASHDGSQAPVFLEPADSVPARGRDSGRARLGPGVHPALVERWGLHDGERPSPEARQGRAVPRRAIKRRLGYARDRVFEVEVTDPVYRVVVSADLTAQPGAN